MRATTIALVIPALLVGTSGCAGDGVEQDQPSQPGTARELTSHERRLLDDAEYVLVQQCMRHAGFKVFITEPPKQPRDLPFGNDDIAFARRHGLGLGDVDMEEFRKENPNLRYVQRMPEARQQAYGVALDGVPGQDEVSVRLPGGYVIEQSSRGCAAQAQDVLYGDFPQWFRVRTRVENLSQVYFRKVVTDRGYRASLRAWQQCMRRRGLAAETPAELRARFVEASEKAGDAPGPPAPAEISAAVAEAKCAAHTGLVRIAERLVRAHRERAYQAHRSLIITYQQMSVAALHRARTTLSSQ